MAIEVLDESNLRKLPDEQRFATCEQILKNDTDESKRWDAVYWLVIYALVKHKKNLLFLKF